MAQFESYKEQFDRAGARVWFIAAQKRHGMFAPEKFFEEKPSSFPFLLDEDRATTKAYGVYHRFGVDAVNIARPASFVIGVDGRIKFMYVGSTQVDRIPPEHILAALESKL